MKKNYENILLTAVCLLLLGGCGHKSITRSDNLEVTSTNNTGFFENVKESMVSLVTEKKSLSRLEYVEWIEDEGNGLKVSKNIADYRFTVQYKPHDYLALKTLKDNGLSLAALAEEKSQIEDLQYYTLQIGTTSGELDLLKSGIASSDEYFERIEYFSFNMQEDLKLVENKDTLRCVLHHFERTYGIAPFSNIVVAFMQPGDKENSETDKESASNKTFIYDDQILGVGTVKLTIQAKNLVKTPSLEI